MNDSSRNSELKQSNLNESDPSNDNSSGGYTSLTFPVLEYVNEIRFKRGIKLEEYTRFRKYCSRKLHLLRRQIKPLPTKTAKYIHEEFPEVLTDTKYLEILILRCDRCWSHGMELKSKCETSSLKNNRGRHHYMRKFGKAYRIALLLEDYCKKFADNNTYSASKVYRNFMEGVLRYEQGKYEEAHTCLTSYSSVLEQKIRTTSGSTSCDWYNSQLLQLNSTIKMCTFHMKVIGKTLSSPQLDQFEDTNAELIQVKKTQDNSLAVYSRGVLVPFQSHVLPQKILDAMNSIDKLVLTDSMFNSLYNSKDMHKTLTEEVTTNFTKDDLLNSYEEVTTLFNDCIDDVYSEMMSNMDVQENLSKLEDSLLYIKSLLQVEKHVALEILSLHELFYKDSKTPLPDSSEGIRYANMLKQQLAPLVDDQSYGSTFLVPKEVVRTVNALLLSIHCFRKGEYKEGMALVNWFNNRSSLDIQLPDKQKNRLLWRCLMSFANLQTICSLACRRFYNRLFVIFARSRISNEVEQDEPILNLFNIERELVHCRPLLFDLAFIYYEPPELETGSRFKGEKSGMNKCLGMRNMLSSLWN